MADLPSDDDGPMIAMKPDLLQMTHRCVPDAPETPAKPSTKMQGQDMLLGWTLIRREFA